MLVVLGLFARTFHAGADYLAFRLADAQGPDAAASVVGATYGTFHVFRPFNAAIMLGWIVLAIGAKRAGVLGWTGAAALACTAALPLGILKGATAFSLVAVVGLAAALVPLGVATLCAGPAPRAAVAARWIAALAAVAVLATLLGQAG